jgi:hypothetical protein
VDAFGEIEKRFEMRRRLILVCLVIPTAWFLVAEKGISQTNMTDSDGDGWSDTFEIRLGSNPNDKESYPKSIEDPDLDGLTNVEERSANTDPTDPDTDNDGLSDQQEVTNRYTDPLRSDSDQDGSSDFTEIIDGTKPHIPDSDGDHWLDGAEKDAGTDPLDLTSAPGN